MSGRRVALLGSLLWAACGASAPNVEPPEAGAGDAAPGDAPLDAGQVDAGARDAGGSVGDAGASSDASAGDAAPSDPLTDAGPDAQRDDAVSHYGLDWLEGVDGGFVTHASIEIDASVARVWQLVRDVNGYGRWCSVLSADAGSVAPGAPIHLAIQLDDPPAAPTESDEQITVVDDARHAIAWSRDFGFGQATLRFQIVTPSPAGARYTTALRYPAELGSIVVPLLGPQLDRAFQTIASDLARAAR